MSDVASMSLGLPADIDADVGAVESGADDLDAVCRKMTGQAEGAHSRFQSSAGEFTDLIAWNIVSGSSEELAAWQEAAAALTYGAAVLRQWGLDIEAYRVERAKLETRWEEEKSALRDAGNDSILGSAGQEATGRPAARMEELREELLTEHAGHWETLMDRAEQAEKDLRDGPGQETLERLVESALLSGSQLLYLGDSVPGMVPDELTGDEHPSIVNLWWTSMTEEEQEQAVRDHPDLLRELDGIPSAVRDELNREHLDDEIERLEEEVANAQEERDEAFDSLTDSDGGMGAYNAQTDLTDLEGELSTLTTLRDNLEDDGADRYLLALDAEGGGRAIVANGNPDTADNVATLVPGTTTTWQSIDSQMNRADALVQSATGVDEESNHSVISWIGYDAPNAVEAAGAGRAEDAVDELSSFQDGLRATHVNPSPSNNTVIGHSYGSTVVGHTAQGEGGLNADNIVLVGSPGANADHVSDLGLAPENVHVSTAENDNITHLTGFTHGMDPTDPDFGATEFRSNPGTDGGQWPLNDAHSEYFDPDTKSLRYMGEVIAGQK
ncbi:alpha/beta hydrolase [Nocardiopsis sp. CA-288880]|uniref:alpha/beta hydrolase n=1 Tax=Nocardiopsis sp. CA-288880 TaxID=3239995 RepID=UPI003D97D21C